MKFTKFFHFFFLLSGRIHSAMVSKINYDARSVTVEWYERNETKGKEIELDTILQLNAELAQQEELAASMPKIIKQTSSNALTRVSISRPFHRVGAVCCISFLLFMKLKQIESRKNKKFFFTRNK